MEDKSSENAHRGVGGATDRDAARRPGATAEASTGPGSFAAPGTVRLASRTGRWLIVTTVLGSSMALLDSTVVNVALPHIGRDLNARFGALQWTVNAYTVTLAGLILLGGALGDRMGRRRIFVVGVVWFAIGSLLCGLSPNITVLVLSRALQGIGGALLTPGSLALIQASFHPDDRARSVGLWSGFGGVGAAIGPFVGGWLVDGPGWRWVFWLNVPFALICVPIALRHVPESRDPTAHRRRFDVLGALLCALALTLVTYALIAGQVWAGVGGVVAGVAFILVERRSPDPMLPLSIFRSRLFTSVNLVTVCVYAAFGGFFFLVALQLQVVAGYSALAAGLALLPTTVLMLLFSAKSGELGERIGPRIPLTVGPLICAVALLMMLRIGRHAAYFADVLPGLLVMGLGLVALVAPLTATVLSSVDTARAGIASGINNAVARAAGLLAVAALPLIAGASPEAYRSADKFDSVFRRAMPVCAGILVVGSLIAAWRVRAPGPPAAAEPGVPVEAEARVRPQCRHTCPVGAPPLEGHDVWRARNGQAEVGEARGGT
ncbi:MFS transporter [Streptomyces odontomachi]|uniref:MFS transporter n=1 Tax=Streptomyces odontomachi TaxID=2944940 RepID=UPI00210A0FA0|nr:MFS transporter [Streptomyces sp. ODS25]